MTSEVELPLMHWIWLTALSGVVSNIGWELFNYFGHATLHSFASAWHEFKKLPSHVFSIHAPLRVAGVVLAAFAVISLAQSTGGFSLGAVPLQLIELYRSFAHGVADQVFAVIINPETRHAAYDLIVVALIMIFVVWRTAAGWRDYAEFQNAHGGREGGLSLGTYFGLQIAGALSAIVIALAILERVQ